jgi:pimeloyl-ACP methyl ester carboxylesterase
MASSFVVTSASSRRGFVICGQYPVINRYLARLSRFSWGLLVLLGVACTGAPNSMTNQPLHHTRSLPPPDTELTIAQVADCAYSDDDGAVRLNSGHALNVIVHGCFSSAGRFRALADVFAFHGQQTVCFSYDDRDSLQTSSAQLLIALNTLSAAMPDAEFNVIAHSQGGLIARRALVENREDSLSIGADRVQLATISAPFAGIAASAHCGSPTLAVLSLGLVKPICYLITGAKYREIPATSQFINQPGRLASNVTRHLRIVTDEMGTCRRYNAQGICVEDDYVFSVAEQQQPVVDGDQRVEAVMVEAGHVEIVGDETRIPHKLIDILQRHNILQETATEQKPEFAALLERIYLSQGRSLRAQ